ncbi:vasoactive intestinal polypeptide receptor 2-like isoform X4 [Ailuropoda melanoleuca]|uniref:vasoactive intestinal polypeptide receptor 2-like isoform X4 n=1 Tax=Ailuropoda melanoleuca TaxID=9646 RepID=UPI001494D1EA|nr:vasoactive intestinal polypeptide receptor 2-like isoform X4 [Ailuropoda melanoleuca]
MRAPALLPPALLTCCGWLLAPVNSVHPECRFHLEIQEEETKCAELLRTQTEKYKVLETQRLICPSSGPTMFQVLTAAGGSHAGQASFRLLPK